jgi:hypothetical protein
MTYKEFYDYFYKAYSVTPLSAQVSKQDKSIFHLKMEIGKLRKQLNDLSRKKGDK